MIIQRPQEARIRDIAFFAVILVYVWAGIDTRLIYHWQGCLFYWTPGFLNEFLKYPGGIADYLSALIGQAYAFQGLGAIVLTAQIAAVTTLTQAYFTRLAGSPVPVVRFTPAALLLSYFNLYYDRRPMVLSLLLGLALAIPFMRFSRKWRSEAALLGAFLIMLMTVYYLAGLAIVFFVPAATILHIARRARRPVWITYLLLGAALPVTVEWFQLTYVPISSQEWFKYSDIVCWGLYAFYPLGTAIVLWRQNLALDAAGVSRPNGRAARLSKTKRRTWWPEQRTRPRLTSLPATMLLLLGLGCVAAASYRANSRHRHVLALDYYSLSENWPAVIDTSRHLATGDFSPLIRYEVNLALHEMNRMGDDMFRFPQAPSLLLDLRIDRPLVYLIRLSDMCLRLGRVNEAERFGTEAMVMSGDPRTYRVMARVNMVKGQTAAARKFLTLLSSDLVSGPWARQRFRELDQDPQLGADQQIQLLRRRMLRIDDMVPVWYRGNNSGPDVERVLLDQLEQDPSNRMAFEFLMGSYLLANNLKAIRALMPRIKDMTGPAYVNADGTRRMPRHYQEAMAMYYDISGESPNIDGFQIQPETFQRMRAFKANARQFRDRDAAMGALWGYRDTYFFYYSFGRGDYR